MAELSSVGHKLYGGNPVGSSAKKMACGQAHKKTLRIKGTISGKASLPQGSTFKRMSLLLFKQFFPFKHRIPFKRDLFSSKQTGIHESCFSLLQEFCVRLCPNCKKVFSPALLYLPILLFDFSTCTSKSANYTVVAKTISIFHGCMVWIEKSVTRVTDLHHEACRVMPNSDPE